MTKKAHIVYFSGTGGTALAAETLSDALEKNSIAVRRSEIFRDSTPKPVQDETLVLMFPVYAADAPSPIYEWIARLEETQNCKAAVIAVSGGGEVSPNTACRAKSIERLQRKGFEVMSEYMLCMPSNFIAPTPKDIAAMLFRVLPEKCEKIADEIAEEKQNRKKPFFIDRIMTAFLSMEKLGSKIFGRTLKAGNECSGCSLCAEKCPRGNIVMDGDVPKFGWKCVLCMRCVYACPKKAIHARLPILKSAVLKDGFDLGQIKKTAESADIEGQGTAVAGVLWKAVMCYINEGRV